MPCRDDSGPSTVYIHADDCECKKCRAEKVEDRRQEALVKKLKPKYMKQLEEGLVKLNLPILGFIHQEKNRIEEHLNEYELKSIPVATKEFEEWLKSCCPFPEKMKFKFMELFGVVIVVTWHEHKRKS